MWQHGHFHWNELLTRDVEGAKAFYGKIAGWRFEGMSMPDGTYWVCKDGEQPVGGMMDISGARFAGGPVRTAASPRNQRLKRLTTAYGPALHPSDGGTGLGGQALPPRALRCGRRMRRRSAYSIFQVTSCGMISAPRSSPGEGRASTVNGASPVIPLYLPVPPMK